MKKYLFVAALLCGTSFASVGAITLTTTDRLHEVTSQQKANFVSPESIFSPESELNYFFSDYGYWQFNTCGHRETLLATKAEAMEYQRYLVSVYC